MKLLTLSVTFSVNGKVDDTKAEEIVGYLEHHIGHMADRVAHGAVECFAADVTAEVTEQ